MQQSLTNQQDSAARVSTLELFFDLVFVFTITQVSDLILHAENPWQIMRAFLVLALIWWMYGGYAWLTNNVGTTQPLNRVLVLIAMGSFLVMALAIPHAFDRDGLAFGIAYLVVNLIHAALFTRAPDVSSARAIWRIAPFNITTASLVVIAGVVDPAWNWMLWLGALTILGLVPFFRKVSGFSVQPAHFVERHGLVLIIALGESIISIGVGAAGEPVGPLLIIAATLILALTAALWWSYFSLDEQRAERALSHVQAEDRARMALYAFGYAHLVMIAGIVLSAAGIKLLIAHLHEPTSLMTSSLLASGIAVYLLGDVLFRRWIFIPSSRLRLAMVALSLTTALVGLWAGGLLQVGALLLIFIIILGWEAKSSQQSAVSSQA